ncbi:MAG: PCRF domain-containing protein, partial [Planctomycetota bacterium]|nr:PCRF domain-containing protein [Planctomycetota bacterium]
MTSALDSIPQTVIRKLDELAARRADLARELEDPDTLADHRRVRDLSIKKAALDPLVDRYDRLKSLAAELADLRAAADSREDPDFAELARAEIPSLESRIESLSTEVLESLVTADDGAIASVILELRAGVGGDEAGLWAADLLDMYKRLAEHKRWRFELLELSESVSGAAGGGVKSAIISVEGEGVWSALSHEAGVHCVKRVPATEAQGRIHTSTATVAALPEPEEVDIDINPDDVVEHVTTAQGPGGQNVNKVA